MADIARKTKRYPSDLTDEEWECIQPLLPRPPMRRPARDAKCNPLPGAQRRRLAYVALNGTAGIRDQI
jgi:transposase